MSTLRFPAVVAALILTVMLTSSCAWWRGGPGSPEHGPGDMETSPAATTDRAQLERRLRDLVAERIRHRETQADRAGDALIFRSPFWLREYVRYPGGPASIRVELRDTQSSVAPFVGTVRLEKQRFATRMYRRQDEALADRNFLRDTGVEELTYEFRYGRWVRVGAMFVAERTERQVDGVWMPVEPEVRATIEPRPEPEGVFQRTWSRILGR